MKEGCYGRDYMTTTLMYLILTRIAIEVTQLLNRFGNSFDLPYPMLIPRKILHSKDTTSWWALGV